MAKANKTQVSDNDPKLVLENGDQNTTDIVVKDAPETQTGEVVETETVEQNITDAVVNDAQIVTSEEKKDLVWIRVLLPLAGKFLMSHDPGHEIEIDSNQAQAIVDAGYGEFIENKEVE
jgi:hypothetical protein